jgi:DNA-binding response OmpR family regulator
MSVRIVLIDRRREDGAGLAAYLARHGLPTDTCHQPEHVLDRLFADPPGLVILHRRLQSDADLNLLRRLRGATSVPIILRAMDGDDEVDRVMALEIGADDYAASGISQREILARVRTVLRRAGAVAGPMRETPAGWRLCTKQRELFAPDGSPRHLTSAEFELMQSLLRHQGMPVHRDALSLQVLRRQHYPEDRALDNLVLRLRRKIGDGGASARLIKSVRGVGYVFTGFDSIMPPRPPEATHAVALMPC